MQMFLPVLIVGIIGIAAGIILSFASTVMAVPKDETAEALEEALPGANCGACGYSGCSGYAEALAKGEAETGLCAPGGADVAEACAQILGVEAGSISKKTALVHCMGSFENTGNKMIYDGIQSCAATTLLAGGISDCRYGCLGMGDCIDVCDYGAINIYNGVAYVNPDKCVGCSMCVKACPKNLISFVTLKNQAVVRCLSCAKPKDTMQVCKVGCIGCKRCVKACPVDAVTVKNFCAFIDADKCIGCGKCAEDCPRQVITMQ